MTEKIIITALGKEVKLPGNLHPDVEVFVENVLRKANEEFRKTDYGHTAVGMVSTVLLAAAVNATPEEQQEKLRLCVRRAIQKYDKNVIPFLRDELGLALSEEDIQAASANRST